MNRADQREDENQFVFHRSIGRRVTKLTPVSSELKIHGRGTINGEDNKNLAARLQKVYGVFAPYVGWKSPPFLFPRLRRFAQTLPGPSSDAESNQEHLGFLQAA